MNRPTQRVRSLVLDRDDYQCVACGKHILMLGDWWSMQHRKARGQGGTNEPSNLIVLCGSATSPGCHLKCEQRDREMQARGYWLESWQDPRAEGVMYFERPDGPGVTHWLADDGSLLDEAPEEAA